MPVPVAAELRKKHSKPMKQYHVDCSRDCFWEGKLNLSEKWFWQSTAGSPRQQEKHFKRHRLKKDINFFPPKDFTPSASPLQRANITRVVTDFPSARLSFAHGSNWGRKVCGACALMFGGGGHLFNKCPLQTQRLRKAHPFWKMPAN